MSRMSVESAATSEGRADGARGFNLDVDAEFEADVEADVEAEEAPVSGLGVTGWPPPPPLRNGPRLMDAPRARR